MVWSALGSVDEAFKAHLAAGGDPLPGAFDASTAFSTVNAAEVISLNSTSSEHIQPGALVKFRCMVQDTFDPELYLDIYESADKSGNDRALHSGRYRDSGNVHPSRVINFQSPRNKMEQRQTLYCVPIPGVTTWAKSMHDVMDIKVPVEPSFAGGTSIPRKKRGARDFDKDDMDTSEESAPSCAASEKRVKATDLHSNEVHNAPSDAAASAAEPLASSSVGGSFDMNFPLPNEVGPAVMVKIYGQEAPKITQLVEITGIYEIDPTIGVHDFTSDDDFGDMADELRVHNPPASIIPRVHCVSIMPLAHANPVVPGMQAVTREMHSLVAGSAAAVRNGLIKYIQNAVGMSSINAEFILLHLLSSVHNRQDDNTLVLGKFSLNLLGIPSENADFTARLATVLQSILPCFHHLPMSLATLNTMRMNPKKNSVTNRLEAGFLQLHEGMELLLDECAMETGKLNETGVKNLQSLAGVLTHQTVTYEFEYTPITFATNIRALVVSEGKSLLPVDFHIPYAPSEGPHDASMVSPSDEVLMQFRAYLCSCASLSHTIDDEVKAVIQNDFVQMRQADPKGVQGSTLHLLLSLARLVAQSRCEPVLTVDAWKATRALEEQRQASLSLLPQPSRPQPPPTVA